MKNRTAIIISAVFLALLVAPVAAAYTPHAGDFLYYSEQTNLGNGTGDYAGYTEYGSYTGLETINGVNSDGTVSAHYTYAYTWSNSSGTTETGNPSGDFTFSPTTFVYINGTDDQEGYTNPSVWFCIDPSTPVGETVTLLDTEMTVKSTNYNYYLESEGKTVVVIFAEGTSTYQRNDVYGQFSASYVWDAYFDPATGYIVGYGYNEQDNSASASFTYTEDLQVTQTSYPLITATGTPSATSTPFPLSTNFTGNPNQFQVSYVAVGAAIFVVFLVIIVVLLVVLSRRPRKLPQHSYQQPLPPTTQPPENIDLRPNSQPPVQQIVVKEVVKVKCRYCGALIDSTAQTCPICGAPRT